MAAEKGRRKERLTAIAESWEQRAKALYEERYGKAKFWTALIPLLVPLVTSLFKNCTGAQEMKKAAATDGMKSNLFSKLCTRFKRKGVADYERWAWCFAETANEVKSLPAAQLTGAIKEAKAA